MATAVIWYSDKADDPLEMKLVIDKAKDWCAMHRTSFNRLVNDALRKAIGMPALDVEGIKAKLKSERQARLEKARAMRAPTPPKPPAEKVTREVKPSTKPAAEPSPAAKPRSKKRAL